jgi:hypothetical protein
MRRSAHNVRCVTAYDELNAFQFKGGKGYDKRSVEEFRARTLNVLDDVLRANVHLEERLAHQAQPPALLGPVLSADEQDLLDRFRPLSPAQRFELLQRMEGVDSGTPVTFAPDLDHWTEGSWTPTTLPSAGEPFAHTGLSEWDAALTSTPHDDAVVTSYSQPDWLTEWESAVPLEPLTPHEQPWELHELAAAPLDALPTTTTDTFGAESADRFTTAYTTFEVGSLETASAPYNHEVDPVFDGDEFDLLPLPQWAPPENIPTAAKMAPFMQPAQPESEVGPPIMSEVVTARPEHRFQESPLSPERLDDLFSQLDFGPPSLDLLPQVHACISDLVPHGAPMHVGLAPEDDQPLPPPVRPWDGWIK